MAHVKCSVLIIDDNDDTAEMLKILLGEEEYEVTTAATMQEALSLASKEFDLYVLDKRLPDGNGVELCAKLNQITPGVPCIFYTGDAYEVHRVEAIAAGADAYVAKPDVEGLIENINKLLAKAECVSDIEVRQ
jgi:DNA-binding response OmpR family regulator